MKKSPKLRAILGTLTILIFLMLILADTFWPSGIDLKVSNYSDKPIKNVKIILTGSNILLGEIKPKENKRLEIKTRGDTGLTIEYDDFEHNTFMCKCDVYIMKSSSGAIAIYIRKPGDVSYTFLYDFTFEKDVVTHEKAICDCIKAKERK